MKTDKIAKQVQCKECKYFKQKSIDHGICTFDRGLLNMNFFRKCNSFIYSDKKIKSIYN